MRIKFILVVAALLATHSDLHAQSMRWEQLPWPTTGAINCITSRNDTVVIGTADSGIYRSFDGGNTWARMSGNASPVNAHALIIFDSQIFAGTFNSGMYRAPILGDSSSWSECQPDAEFEDFVDDGTTLYAGSIEHGVYRSNDRGLTWAHADTGLPHFEIRTLCRIGNTIYAGAHGAGIYSSSNSGDVWSPVPNQPEDLLIHALIPVGSTLFAGTHLHAVYRSTDLGNSWQRANDGIVNQYIIAMASVGTIIFAATSNGIYRSDNLGDSWESAQGGMIDTTTLAFGVMGNTLFAGTDQGRLYRATVLREDVATPQSETGWSMIPNPILSSGTFRYSLPEADLVRITISDALGRIIDRPVAPETQNVGIHEVPINGRSLAPGVYTLKLTTPHQTGTTNFIVIK